MVGSFPRFFFSFLFCEDTPRPKPLHCIYLVSSSRRCWRLTNATQHRRRTRTSRGEILRRKATIINNSCLGLGCLVLPTRVRPASQSIMLGGFWNAPRISIATSRDAYRRSSYACHQVWRTTLYYSNLWATVGYRRDLMTRTAPAALRRRKGTYLYYTCRGMWLSASLLKTTDGLSLSDTPRVTGIYICLSRMRHSIQHSLVLGCVISTPLFPFAESQRFMADARATIDAPALSYSHLCSVLQASVLALECVLGP